jgi:hypothetical protein
VPRVDPNKGALAATRAAAERRHLTITFSGKAPSSKEAIDLWKRFQAKKDRFIDVKPLSTQVTTAKSPEYSFTFNCTYVPAETPVAAAAPAPATK